MNNQPNDPNNTRRELALFGLIIALTTALIWANDALNITSQLARLLHQ